jgi:hypothetical protein
VGDRRDVDYRFTVLLLNAQDDGAGPLFAARFFALVGFAPPDI